MCGAWPPSRANGDSAEPTLVAAQTFVPEQSADILRAAVLARTGNSSLTSAAPGLTTAGLVETLRRLYLVSFFWGGAVAAAVYVALSLRVLRLITPSTVVVALVPRAPLVAICILISPMLLSEGSLLGFGATVATRARSSPAALCLSPLAGPSPRRGTIR